MQMEIEHLKRFDTAFKFHDAEAIPNIIVVGINSP